MDFGTLKIRLGRRRGFDGDPARLGQFINDAVQEIVGARNQWSWLLRHHQFETKPTDTTGAASTGDVATVTAGSHKVQNIADLASKHTLTGALIALPDDNCYRIASVGLDEADKVPTIFLEQPYRGTSSSSAVWKIYYDEYPLPSGTSSIQSVVVTGNGWSFPIRQISRQPGHVHRLPTRDSEASPSTYSVVTHSQLPPPDGFRWLDLPYLFAPVTGTVGPDAGTYKYWIAYRVHHTNEIGPLSGPVSFTNPLDEQIDLRYLPALHDFGLRIFRSSNGGDIPYFLADVDPVVQYAGGTYPSYRDTLKDSEGLGIHPTSRERIGRHETTHGSHRIRLWPPVDEHYLVDIQHYVSHPELVEDNDVPLIPTQYANAILDFAEALALSEEENHTAAMQKRGIGMTKLERIVSEEDEDPDTRIVIGGGETHEDRYDASGRWPRRLG